MFNCFDNNWNKTPPKFNICKFTKINLKNLDFIIPFNDFIYIYIYEMGSNYIWWNSVSKPLDLSRSNGKQKCTNY